MTPENENTILTDDTATQNNVGVSDETVTTVPETPAVPATPEAPAYKLGVVVDCVKLNVRKSASTSAKVVCTIPNGTKVAAFDEDGSDEFYRIETAAGVEGYCMKKYIDVKQ